MTTLNDRSAAGSDPNLTRQAQAQFRRTLVRVMAMQIGALIALWLLQSRYSG